MSLRSEIIRIINQVLLNSKKISELDEITTPTTNDYLEIVQSGVNYKIKKGNLVTGGGGGGVNSVTGTLDRITISGTAADPIVDIAATYAGQTSIITLGTVTTGSWNASVIPSTKGGAGSVNGILKANGSGVVSAAVSGTDYEVPLTFSTGLTRTVNTITVNTTQSITKLSNLTSNGIVTTSGGDGTLGITVPGTGVLTALAVNVGTSGSFVVNGGALGTPSSGTLTNATGLPISSGVSGLGTGVATFLGTPSWTNFSAMITGTAPFWATTGTTTVTTPTITGKVTWTQASESSSNTFHAFTQAAHTGGTPTGILYNGGAHTTLTAATESPDINFNLNRTVQFNGGGTFPLQRSVVISGAAYSATSSTTITDLATLSVVAPTAGTNVIATNRSSIIVVEPDNTVHVALHPINVNFGQIAFGNGGSGKANRGSIGSSSTAGSFSSSGTSLRFHANTNAATAGAFQFTTFTSNILNTAASVFLNASPTYAESSSIGASHSVYRTGFTFTHAGTTGNRITGFLADPTFNITSTNASTIEAFAYTPTQTALNSNSVNKAWRHNSGIIQWESILSPSQITSNQNDYNPTGLNTGGAPNGATIVRLSSDASRDITSIVGGVTGRILILVNVGSQNIVLKDDDGATGTAANRLQLNADITLLPEQSIMLWYDGTSSRWRSMR